MKVISFIFINFIVSFLSDIILNDLSKTSISPVIQSLEIYFKDKSIIYSAFLAGITIVLALIITMLFTSILFGFYVPSSNYELIRFLCVGFIIGYIIDILIDQYNIFGNSLDKYYKIAGAGLWGAVAFIFSIGISYIIQKFLLPVL